MERFCLFSSCSGAYHHITSHRLHLELLGHFVLKVEFRSSFLTLIVTCCCWWSCDISETVRLSCLVSQVQNKRWSSVLFAPCVRIDLAQISWAPGGPVQPSLLWQAGLAPCHPSTRLHRSDYNWLIRLVTVGERGRNICIRWDGIERSDRFGAACVRLNGPDDA